MKMFNWIHRHRFPYNIHPTEVSLTEDGSSARRSGSTTRKGNIERKPLLDEVKTTDWELDRILTIGTLAIDPLGMFNLQDEEGDIGEVEDSYHEEKTEDAIFIKEDPICETEMCKLYPHNEIEEVEEEIVYEKLTNLEKRVTLLDLFKADEIDHKVAKKEGQADDDVDKEINKTTMVKKKNKLLTAMSGKKGLSSKAKKLLTNGDVPPLKKLHRFMTKMMKKKIHPDMEGRLQKKGQAKLNDDVSMGIDGHASINGQYPAAESVFLFPSQGITV